MLPSSLHTEHKLFAIVAYQNRHIYHEHESGYDMAKHFPCRLYFHGQLEKVKILWSLAHKVWNVSSYHTLTRVAYSLSL